MAVGQPVIQALLLDLDGTLVDRDAALDRVVTRWLGEEALPVVRALDQSGRSDRRAFCQALAAHFPSLGPPETLWYRLLAEIAEAIEPDPAVTAALEALLPHFLIGVVTNGGPQQRRKLERAGLSGLLPQVWVSSEVGADKPHPRIFQAALQGLGVAAEQALFVGDDLQRDIEGALALGMAAVWVGGDPALGHPTIARFSALPGWLHQRGILSSSPSP